MDLMNSIAAQSMSMRAEEFSQQYSLSLQKKAMNMEEQALEELLDMLPPTPPMGTLLDVRA